MSLSTRSRSRSVLYIVLLAGVFSLGLITWLTVRSSSKALAISAPPAFAVTAATVRRLDVVRSLSALGNVQSLNNVLLRPQVDGVLTRVLVREGEAVKKDQLLAQIDDRSLSAAVAQANADNLRNQANLRIAELNLRRDEKLLAEQAISNQAVDEQRALVEQLKATAMSGESALEAARIQLSYTRITSPVSGKVGMRRVDPGNLVHANDAMGLFSVVQVDPISVVFSLPQQALTKVLALIGSGTSAQVVVFDRDTSVPIAIGGLQTLDNQIDATTGTLQLRAVFANAQNALWPGAFVTVQLKTGVDKGVLAVSSRAIQHGIDGLFAFRVRDSKAEVVHVVVRYEEAGLAVIDAGLRVGDIVVTEGQDQLKPDMPVNVVAYQQEPGGEHPTPVPST
jgi:RND family efflux transporter MFP subunit